ncbi:MULTISPECIES: hypothetical protein [Clostridium]|jgi:hypothetical protein|uniref:hypothetical protein n=1 Tax=Clostridium TaxID=1485 RepID=UPI00242BE826|nr:hypothetical protein [Clostridium tyrobutyricum]
MEAVYNIITSENFNIALTNLLIDLYSPNYKKYFKELTFSEKEINQLDNDSLEKLTKAATIIEYVGNRQPDAILYDWIYSKKLKLKYPYTPGVEENSIERLKRILFAPKEFSSRNVFYDEGTIKPI